MEAPAFGFDGYVLVGPPELGFWRVSRRDDPFDPPPPPPPLGEDPRDDDGHRYDDPTGLHRTLYCATEAEGALGEYLGEFAYSARAAIRIDAYLESDPDAEFDLPYHRPLEAADIESFGWNLAHAGAHATARLIAVDDWRTYRAASRKALPALARYGVQRFDRHTLLDQRRQVTRTMAGVFRDDATDPDTGELRAAGLRFTSRLPPAWECWALWEPLPLDPDADPEAVTIETPALRRAADMLGIALSP